MINLDEYTTLLTPNRRLSATLLKQYNQEVANAVESKGKSWKSFDILPFNSWIQRLWQNYSSVQIIDKLPIILTPAQELVLWEEILQKHLGDEGLLQISETAKLAKSAWDTLKQWRLDLTDPILKSTDDSDTFLRWATHFQQQCVENHWLDTSSLIDSICKKILTSHISVPKRIIAVGFTELSPLQHYLFACCEQVGTTIIYDIKTDCTPSQAERISLPDEENEIRTMARWAKSLTEAHPTRRIGCVVPNLEKKRDSVYAIFSEVFSDNQLYALDSTIQPFNITAGKTLANYPIIQAALKLLNLNKETITSENMSDLLLSPFLGDAEYEQSKRAKLDFRLREANIMNIALSQLIHTKEKFNVAVNCPRLAMRLTNFLTLLNEQPSLLSISEWIRVFLEALSLLGWPGERSINSQEYQTVQRWLELLDEYKTFDRLLHKKNYQDALYYLTRLSLNIVFQPQSTDTAVQVLGILEATALPFDYTWVMGFDDNAWPPHARPNPFIPRQLQSTLNMPHSSAEHEFHYSKRLTKQLKESTQHIIFSHSKSEAGCELRASPLISDLPEIYIENLTLNSFRSPIDKCRQSRLIETIEDNKAPAVNFEKNHGGASLFKLQAACPFKAFSEIRLHAKPLESTTLGLKPQDRGQITHKALELAWTEIKTSDKLQQYTEFELKQLLKTAVTQAIQLITHQSSIESRYFSLEIERLQNLLWNWLQIEKSRPPFTVIAQEQECVVHIANLPIRLRIDRVDKLQDNSHLIIDYKTGKNNQIKYWFGDRLDEPQLPLYCISADNTILGIAYAEINPESLALKGISKHPLSTHSIKPLLDTNYSEGRSWEEQIKHWQFTLEKLGNEFSAGHAEVDPKTEIETCSYCSLKPFCRITDHHSLSEIEEH